MSGKKPCDMCDSTCGGCAWHEFYVRRCASYDCIFFYGDGCMMRFDKTCKASTCYEEGVTDEQGGHKGPAPDGEQDAEDELTFEFI